MTYDQLLDEAFELGIDVKEKSLQSGDGRIYLNRIAIRKDLSTASKACVLAEDLGHFFTTEGNILEQKSLNDVKQERLARIWAYNKLLSIDKIIDAASKGYTEIWNMAEYLDIDEKFLREYLIHQGILDISL